jgi:hypothetical protein
MTTTPAMPGAAGTQTILQIPLQQKINLMLVVAITIALGSGAWLWGTTPDYRVLHANLAERDGGAVIASHPRRSMKPACGWPARVCRAVAWQDSS